MTTDVSVIIPCYNGERWLPLSMRSVLSQKGAALEIIVVDDGSEVSAKAAVNAMSDERVRFIRIAHSGKGAAVNCGIKEARGEAVCVLDQDDLMLEGRLETQFKVLNAHPEADAVYSDYERVTENGERIDIFVSHQASNREMLHAMASSAGLISMQTMLIRKKSLELLGCFSGDSSLTGLDDGEFFARLLGSGAKLLYVPGIAGQWVSHGGNYSKGPEFQEARLSFLSRLDALGEEYPLIRGELDYFRAHAYLMRGIYFLQHRQPESAAGELRNAVRARPCMINAHYLFLKAMMLSLFKKAFPDQ